MKNIKKEPQVRFQDQFPSNQAMFDGFAEMCVARGFVPVHNRGLDLTREGGSRKILLGPGLSADRRFLDPKTGMVVDVTPYSVKTWTWPTETPGSGAPMDIDSFIRKLMKDNKR